MNFLKIHVLEQEDLNSLIDEGECTSIEDIDCNKVDFGWDYHQIALVDADKNERVIWNDNMHTYLENDINNFLSGLKHANIVVNLQETAMLSDDVLKKFNGVTYF